MNRIWEGQPMGWLFLVYMGHTETMESLKLKREDNIRDIAGEIVKR